MMNSTIRSFAGLASVWIVMLASGARVEASQTRFFPAPVVYSTGGWQAGQTTLVDVNGDGVLDMVISNRCVSSQPCFDSGNGTIGILLGKGDGTFQAAAIYDTGGPVSRFLTVADVNGDGKPDVLVVNSCSLCAEGTVGVLLGNGDGTFRPAVTYDTGGRVPSSLVVADINGDGKPDLVVTNPCTGSTSCGPGGVGLLLGNGDGTFRAAVTYAASGGQLAAAAVADVNGDGKPDVLLLNNCTSGCAGYSSGSTDVLLGNGDGTLQAARTYPSGGLLTSSMSVADLNGDGKLDLILGSQCTNATSCGNGVLDILLGNGDGTFRTAVPYTGWQTAVVADVNGDGKLDLVASGLVGSSLVGGVLLGKGDGTFQPALQFGAGQVAAIADLNGDGKLDLVAECSCYGVDVLLGNGDGTFAPKVTYRTGTQSPNGLNGPVSVADLNRDGKLDIVATNGCSTTTCGLTDTVGVLLNTFNPLATQTTVTSSLNPAHVGQSVRFTATVTGLDGGRTTGTVTFHQGPAVLGTASVLNGQATLLHAFAAKGGFLISATFSGDSFNRKSVSSKITQVVMP